MSQRSNTTSCWPIGARNGILALFLFAIVVLVLRTPPYALRNDCDGRDAVALRLEAIEKTISDMSLRSRQGSSQTTDESRREKGLSESESAPGAFAHGDTRVHGPVNRGDDGEDDSGDTNSNDWVHSDDEIAVLARKDSSEFHVLTLRDQRKLRRQCKRKDPRAPQYQKHSGWSPFRRQMIARYARDLQNRLPFFSDHGVDEWIYENVYESRPENVPRDGVFVDVGAREPEIISNSIFWDYFFCWTGLAVEANEDVYPLQRKYRPWSSVNVAIDEKDRDVTFLKIKGKGHGFSGIYENMSRGHRGRIRAEVKEKNIERIPMRTTTLSILMKRAQIKHVNILVIDVEGSELAVLRSIDWDNVTIDVINFEKKDNVHEIHSLLKSKGFRVVMTAHLEMIYIMTGFKDSLPEVDI